MWGGEGKLMLSLTGRNLCSIYQNSINYVPSKNPHKALQDGMLN